ncbi:MAG: mannosyltransferase family protein, partial [Micropruina sp.]
MASLSADRARLVVQVWLGSRLVLVLAALWFALTTGRTATEMLANWDVQHFFRIAEDGYAHANDVAFFPGWPLLLRLFSSLGVPMLVAGVALSVLGSALAAWALYRLGGALPAVAWLLVPTTVFTLVPYTESVFCAAA